MISFDRTASFYSGLQTGTGSVQTFKHGLGAIPDFIILQENSATVVKTIGTPTATDITVTIDNGVTYKFMAFVFAN